MLDQLHRLYQDPHGYARAWKARTGKQIVGCLGLAVPHELVEAVGLLPVRVTPHPKASLDAVRSFCEGASGPILSSLATRLLDGTYDYLDYLVISPRPTFHVELHAFFRELERTGARCGGPHIRLLDLHHDDKVSTVAFNLDSMTALKSDLKAWSGIPLTDAALQAAIAAGNQNRLLLQELDQLRTHGRLKGSDMLVLAETSSLIDRKEHNQRLQALLQRRDQLPRMEGRSVVYSGSDTDDLSIYQAIEAAECRIVADDQDRGTRQVLPLIEESADPLQALTQRYTRRAPSSWGFRTAERISYLKHLIGERRPSAAIVYVLAADHPTAWDYPAMRDVLDEYGIPSLHLGEQLYAAEDVSQLSRQVRDFISQLDGAKSSPDRTDPHA